MARRLLNVVMEKSQFGVFPGPPPVYSLRRIDPNEFFYPSALEAHAAAAAAKAKKDVISPKGAPPAWMESMSPLPEPEPGFRLLSSTQDERLAFLPLYGRDGGGGDASKILCADQAGHAVLYDADVGCFGVVPSFNSTRTCQKWSSYGISYLLGRGRRPVHGAAAFDDPRRGEALYVLEERRGLKYCHFEALVYENPASECSHEQDENRPNGGAGKKGWRWNRLPSPARAGTDLRSVMMSAAVRCHTLADIGGKTAICVSFNEADRSREGEGCTHCFNTGTQRWTKAGDWMLPFRDRAVHVPELGGLWFGVGHQHPHHLCAMDLSSSFEAGKDKDTPAPPPELLYNWPDPTLPKEWSMLGCNLVYVGDWRFCIAKSFEFSKDEDVIYGRKKMTVISGVEVVRAGPTSSKLQMVRHRSRFYEFVGDFYSREFIDCVL